MKDDQIASVAIYPPIGISRVGNSEEYFLSSDLPGIPADPKGGFKDSEGRVKKQVARFRVYAFNANGEVLHEITDSTKNSIEWRVHVANIKSAWYQFNNALDLDGYAIPSAPRNNSEKDRSQLIIDPGTRTISGKNKEGEEYQFDSGTFYGKKVPLGELRTDDEGRLLFFGGNGDSASKDNQPAVTFANNDGWHDDTCDGVVRAKVSIDGKEYEAEPAMVAVTPPDFGPGLYGVVTMNDVVQDLFIRELGYPNPSAKQVVFWDHIYPILERMTDTQWVNQGFFMLFGKNSPSDFTNSDLLKKLSNPAKEYKEERQRVFNWFRDPDSNEYTPAKVPPFYGDGFGEYEKIALVDLPITRTQFERLKKWADGDFVEGKPTVETPFDQLTAAEQLNALNQAPLEECLGGPFHPGIELTWPMRVKLMWKSPYRLNIMKEGALPELNFGPLLSTAIVLRQDGPLSSSGPGSLTRWLGVPWQTDEASCLSGYDTSTYLPLPSFWAARVPNQVLSEDSFERMGVHSLNIGQRLKHFDYRQDWLRDFGSDYTKKINLMVLEWHELGIIAPAKQNNESEFLPDKVWKETGRHFSGEDPTFKQVLYAENIEDETRDYEELDKITVLKSEEPTRKRERRTFRRDER
ncbi:LodA/GoxA family CTQ-dependent oxidase [Aquimarina sp. 2201CG5-10]|uniref:LodA/GoxA family CTQ-dependent oxidase n=1 Tax=Aquimarina callyspongiae TaxID=3098150 RepID=UPI002AB33A35|nr:LodA/GoxA family CTQ-dependent oxidase [Aquimarina sp. 2201CG5-10]MDY8135675.1 LodA/GoxA family CTQ-dependent oxidase [Aquimarina sp. 2201CG5-10]